MQSITIGMDISKSVFQLHGIDEQGTVVIRKRLRRGRLLSFFANLPSCVVGIEACATCHHWARELIDLGHEVRLVPPAYVKPYVKRGKTDAADAEAICEAILRPGMRFVPVKSVESQSALCLHRTRSQLMRQRTRLINLLRAQMAEFGIVVAQGVARIKELAKTLLDPEETRVTELARTALLPVLTQIDLLTNQIKELDKAIKTHARQDQTARALMTLPGVGPVTASAVAATVPDPTSFKSARHFAAWLGLTPKAHDSGLKHRRGPISKMGNRYLRQLLVLGATSLLRRTKSAQNDRYLAFINRLKAAHKPARQITVAAANKCARMMWALMARNETYRAAA